jgi:hypothetical protein
MRIYLKKERKKRCREIEEREVEGNRGGER